MGSRSSDKNNRTIATNRRAHHKFVVETKFEAGIQLKGSEVKSLRDGKLTFTDGHVDHRDDGLWLVNIHIPEYPFANQHNHEPTRPRRLLLKEREINTIAEHVEAKGYTCIPLRFYLQNGLVKVELGLARGKRVVNRRNELKERDAKRDMDRALKG